MWILTLSRTTKNTSLVLQENRENNEIKIIINITTYFKCFQIPFNTNLFLKKANLYYIIHKFSVVLII